MTALRVDMLFSILVRILYYATIASEMNGDNAYEPDLELIVEICDVTVFSMKKNLVVASDNNIYYIFPQNTSHFSFHRGLLLIPS